MAGREVEQGPLKYGTSMAVCGRISHLFPFRTLANVSPLTQEDFLAQECNE